MVPACASRTPTRPINFSATNIAMAGRFRTNQMSKQSKSQWDFGELFPPEQTRKVLSVSELTTQIRALLEKQIGQIWVSGEVTNLRAQSSGHMYFTDRRTDTQGLIRFRIDDANPCVARKANRSDLGERRGHKPACAKFRSHVFHAQRPGGAVELRAVQPREGATPRT